MFRIFKEVMGVAKSTGGFEQVNKETEGSDSLNDQLI